MKLSNISVAIFICILMTIVSIVIHDTNLKGLIPVFIFQGIAFITLSLVNFLLLKITKNEFAYLISFIFGYFTLISLFWIIHRTSFVDILLRVHKKGTFWGIFVPFICSNTVVILYGSIKRYFYK